MMFHRGGWMGFFRYDESRGRPSVDRELIQRVLAYARPYIGSLALMLVAIVAGAGLELIPPLLYRDLIDNVLPNRDVARLNLVALGLLAVPIASGLIGVVQRYYGARVGEGVIYDLRQEMYGHLQNMSLRFFTNTKSGEIVSRFNSDVVGAQTAITGTLPNLITNGVILVSTIAVMLSVEWRLTLLAVAVFPLFLLPARRVGRILREIRRRAMELNAHMSSIVQETLSINGALLVKTFGRQADEYERYRQVNEQVRDVGVRQAVVGRWFFLSLGMAAAIGTALVYWAGGHLVLRTGGIPGAAASGAAMSGGAASTSGVVTIGTLVAFSAYLMRLYGPIMSLSNVQVEFVSSMVSFERVFEYLDLPIEISDRPHAVELTHVSGRVCFADVWFSYQPAGKNTGPAAGGGVTAYYRPVHPRPVVADGTALGSGDKSSSPDGGVDAMPDALPEGEFALRNVSFEIEPGQLVALVGPSGAGKTTLAYLLLRLYDVTRGRVTIDGRDVRDITLTSLARHIGVVMQETYLFHDTVAANLRYARPSATDSEVESACRAANIHDMIAGLPEGYDTVVGERGYRLSGGEKQRLAIARVILKDPRILLLDEATSHLDSHSEALIQAALEPLMRGRTSLVIAHRLSTVMAADQILALEAGRLVEQGTHAELLQRGGLYARLHATQFDRATHG